MWWTWLNSRLKKKLILVFSTKSFTEWYFKIQISGKKHNGSLGHYFEAGLHGQSNLGLNCLSRGMLNKLRKCDAFNACSPHCGKHLVGLEFSVVSNIFHLRSILREKEGKNADTNLTERFEMSIYEDPIGTYFEFKAQENPWNDLDCEFIFQVLYFECFYLKFHYSWFIL